MKYLVQYTLFFILIIAVGTLTRYYYLRENPFISLCLEHLNEKKYEKNIQMDLCPILEKMLFKSQEPVQFITPEVVQSPTLPIDSVVKFIAFYNPLYFSSFGYCYFAFRGWFNPKEMSPKQLALTGSGFAILKSELSGYPEWLKSEKGKECADSLRSSIHLEPIDLDKEMGDKISIIAFSPVGAIRSDEGLSSVLNEARLTINHERVHAIHVTCSEVDKSAIKYWSSLTKLQKEKLKEGHLNYDWNNPTVAVREAFAYFLEEDPTEILKYIGQCKS